MNNILSYIEPKRVFEFFERISVIPRGSGHTDEISDFCVGFACDRGFEYIREECGNVIIFKPGTAGKENDEPIIIQGHLDMVWEKDTDCNIDFLNEGLRLGRNDEYIFAEGTTLGGDDGIAVAMGLALLDSNDIPHPPLEVVFTVGEEAGMDGAFQIDASVLKGRKMINLDSEEEGVFLAGCAGGARADITAKSYFYEKNNGFEPKEGIMLKISGLHGGHSGAEIHLGYLNANKLMGSLLRAISRECDFNLVSLNGGTMDNAITRECACFIAVENADFQLKVIAYETRKIIGEAKKTEPGLEFIFEKSGIPDEYMNFQDTHRIILMLNEFPNGVIGMCAEPAGIVETSLNLGVVKTQNNCVSFTFSVRSSVNSEKNKLLMTLKKIADNFRCDFGIRGLYPAWEFVKDSPFRDKMIKVYSGLFGSEPTVTVIHAGLECGLFSEKLPGLDCVSMGPDIIDIHTPREKLSISSVQRTWTLLLKILSDV